MSWDIRQKIKVMALNAQKDMPADISGPIGDI